MRNRTVWLALVALIGLVLPFNQNVFATNDTKNNLSSEQSLHAADKAAFLVSKEKSQNILEKYSNASHLSDTDLVKLLKAVGFKGDALRTAWAIAKAESNGRPFAFNGNVQTGDNSYGIFQVNMIGTLGPDRRTKFDLDHNADLFNPVINAQIAYHMTKGGADWSAWKHGKAPRVKEFLSKFPDSH